MSENYDICPNFMLSYVECMVKIWARYEHFVMMMLTNWEFPEEVSERRRREG